jgi:hypothetical protein
MRPESPRAVVLRRGGKTYCTIDWSLADDTFSVGQWCKHKLYPQRCDISPSGRWMVYFALNGVWKSETRGAWTALSRAPYLRAVTLWPQGDTWGGGGAFYASAPAGLEEAWDRYERMDDQSRLTYGVSGRYEARLVRNGWSVAPGAQRMFSRSVGYGWFLQKRVRSEIREEHALLAPSGDTVPLPSWDWADFDAPRARVVWAEAGVVYAARAGGNGLETTRALFDAGPMKFEALKAPYHDQPTTFR